MLRVLITTIILGVAVAAPSMAQTTDTTSKHLQGPAFKNAHPSVKYSGKKVISVKGDKAKKLKGPEAKNFKPWKVDKSKFEMVRLDHLNGINSKGLKGPAYKNYHNRQKH